VTIVKDHPERTLHEEEGRLGRMLSSAVTGRGYGKVDHAPLESVGGCSSPSPRP